MNGNQDDPAYQFLSTIGQIKDDIELALNNDVEDETAASIAEVAAELGIVEEAPAATSGISNKAQRAKDRLREALMDDDANRTIEPELDEPEKTETRKDDDKISTKLGYNRFMRDNIWCMGEKRLTKANVKEARTMAAARSDWKLRINSAITNLVRTSRETNIEELKEVQEAELPFFANRMLTRYPEYFDE